MQSQTSDRKTLVIDLDGTLCEQMDSDNYHNAEPKRDVIRVVNQLWTEGWIVVIFTARGMKTCHGDAKLARDKHYTSTVKWLEQNRVCYSRLEFGKPAGDLYVDDKGMSIDDFTKSTFDLRK